MRRLLIGEHVGLLIVLGLLTAFFGSQAPFFLSIATLTAVVNQIPALILASVGMTFVLIVGGIDLAVGSVLALSSCVMGVLMVNSEWTLPGAAAAALVCGGACGLLSGSISVLAGIPSFIVSLGILQAARGMTYLLTESRSIYLGAVPGLQLIGGRISSLKVSLAFLFALGVVLVSQFVLQRTLFGRYCTAIGHNQTAATLSGIRTKRIRIAAFVVSGILSAAAGIADTSRLSSADPNAAIGFELSAIAAAVIGGTSLMGGRGS
ncbi:MAG: ABC transporter permease, partial [Planctomycetaceae bacterium]|nr:ABC transporter permease [Planctomycetaceae bacterium]